MVKTKTEKIGKTGLPLGMPHAGQPMSDVENYAGEKIPNRSVLKASVKPPKKTQKTQQIKHTSSYRSKKDY